MVLRRKGSISFNADAQFWRAILLLVSETDDGGFGGEDHFTTGIHAFCGIDRFFQADGMDARLPQADHFAEFATSHQVHRGYAKASAENAVEG